MTDKKAEDLQPGDLRAVDPPDWAFGELSASDRYKSDKPPPSRDYAKEAPGWTMPVPPPNFKVLELSRNPRVGADYTAPLFGWTVNAGVALSPLSKRPDPSYSFSYKRPF